jgi:hypothetical protein
MNNLIAGAAFRALLMIGGSYLSAKGIATQAEVNSAGDLLQQIGGAAVALGTAAYSIYTRTTAKQVQMTNSLPKVVSKAVAKK